MLTPESMDMFASLAARSANKTAEMHAAIVEFNAKLDAAETEAKQMRRVTEAASVAEDPEIVAGNFGEIATTLGAIERLCQEADKPLADLRLALRQLDRVEARVRKTLIDDPAAKGAADAS